MNLRQPNANEATGTFNRSKSVVPLSGICTRCVDGCRGGCEIWLSSFRGREVLYPIGFGEITAGADKNYPIDYSHLIASRATPWALRDCRRALCPVPIRPFSPLSTRRWNMAGRKRSK
jgi:hypothetical protein